MVGAVFLDHQCVFDPLLLLEAVNVLGGNLNSGSLFPFHPAEDRVFFGFGLDLGLLLIHSTKA